MVVVESNDFSTPRSLGRCFFSCTLLYLVPATTVFAMIFAEARKRLGNNLARMPETRDTATVYLVLQKLGYSYSAKTPRTQYTVRDHAN